MLAVCVSQHSLAESRVYSQVGYHHNNIVLFIKLNNGLSVRDVIVTNDIDFNLSRDRGNIVLKMQGVSSLIGTDAWHDCQLCERRLHHHGNTLVSGQLLLTKGPLGSRGWVSSDGDFDGERLRDDHLQAISEGTQVKGRTDYQDRGVF